MQDKQQVSSVWKHTLIDYWRKVIRKIEYTSIAAIWNRRSWKVGWKLRGAKELLFLCNNTTLKIHPKNFDKRQEETCVGLSNKLRIDLVGASVYLSKLHRDLAQPPPRPRWFMFTKCSWKASKEDKQTILHEEKCMLVLLEPLVIKKIARGHNDKLAFLWLL